MTINNWTQFIAPAVLAHNTSCCRSNSQLGDTPYFLMFGKDCRLAVDCFLGEASPLETNRTTMEEDDYKEELVITLKEAYKRAFQQQEQMSKSYKHYYDRQATDSIIKVGDRVYIKVPKPPKGCNRALTKKYMGPARVIEAGEVAVKCIPCSNPDAVPILVPITRLKLVKETHTPTYGENLVQQWRIVDESLLNLEEEMESSSENDDSESGEEVDEYDSTAEPVAQRKEENRAPIPENTQTSTEGNTNIPQRRSRKQPQWLADYITNQ